MKRSSGIILPVSALPSPYGVGTLGAAAREFVDFLAEAKQAWWQVLPVGPTSYGDSPYQSPSAFAGNPYLIDLDLLIEEGLLDAQEPQRISWGEDSTSVDYALLFEKRLELLRKAFARGRRSYAAELAAFSSEQSNWLDDFALFMAIKCYFGMKSWLDWPDEDLRLRNKEALVRAREELAEEIEFEQFLQFLFFKQWESLKNYAHTKGVKIIGDLPIYVALDSADVWANPEYFQLDKRNMPIEVAGVPPDAFTSDGQLWGNPLYNYEAMERDGFGWWIRRIGGAARLYDMIRIDHFRGFESFWAVPFGEKTAKKGRWIQGPGMKLVGTLSSWFTELDFIAEDLGYHTPEVEQLLRESGMPGMKVLEFAFDSRDTAGSSYLPHAYERECVCYVGTHDNSPIMGWYAEAKPEDKALACAYLGIANEKDVAWAFIRSGMASVANLFVAQAQDYLELGEEARTNKPGTMGNNWKWRLKPGQFDSALAKRIATMTRMYGRSA